MTKPRPSGHSAKTARARRAAGNRPAARLPRISTAIFDLDDTLYDCFGQRVMAAHRRASQAMAEAGVPASPQHIFRLRLKAYRTDPQLSFIDKEVCRRFDIADSEKIIAASRWAFFTLPVTRLNLFPGSMKVLRELKRRGVRIFLVSLGDPKIQHAKVTALGLDGEDLFERIFFAEVRYADLGQSSEKALITKESIFRSIVRDAEPDPRRILVVGDRPSSEIRAGNQLGLPTVRLRHGEFRILEPRGPEEVADYEISRIEQVLGLPFRFGPP